MNHLILPLSLLPAVALGAMHLKVKGSSVLVHFGGHKMGLDDAHANRIAAELVGVLTLNISVDAYDAEHRMHHSLKTFARAGADPDATLLYDIGLRPGLPVPRLWRRLGLQLVSPVFHAQRSAARLHGVFASGPAWRIATAWAFWSALLATAAMLSLLLPALLGFVLPLLVFGNIGSLLELVSEHRFNIARHEGQERQAMLSHARLLGVPPPAASFWHAPLAWAGWTVKMLAATAVRVGVLPGDLSHHDAHHIGIRPALRLMRHGWMNAAYEYSPSLWDASGGRVRRVSSLREAIGEAFEALAVEQATKPDAVCGA